MFKKPSRPRVRPSYPNATRQWQGLIFILICIGAIEVISEQFGRLRSPGGLLVLAILFTTYWSGLRQGLIACLITMAYLTYAYSEPGHLFTYVPINASRLINGAILFPILTFLIGSLDGRLRNAAIREFDAQEKAEEEEGQRLSSERMQHFVLDSAIDAIVVATGEGRVSLWNARAESLFGWRSSEIVGKLLSDTIIPSASREDHIAGLKRFHETGEGVIIGQRTELIAQKKDGQEFPVELSVSVQRTAEGPIFIGFIRDITEQRKLGERLRQAQKMEAIGTLAGGIAHDFNNILTAIKGNIRLAREDSPVPDSVQVSLAEIEKSVRRATYVVRQILTFSHAKESHPEAVDLVETLHDAVGLLRATIPASMQIEELFGSEPLPVFADSTDIHMIVLNLGINASQALGGKGGRFDIEATPVNLDDDASATSLGLKTGEYVRISFRDTGCGMDGPTLERAFDPFFTTKPPGEGTGLGLSVVYGIVTRYGGAVTVYSEVGKGTVFHVYLPRTESEKAAAPAIVGSLQQGRGERVLYIDDDEALVFMMSRMLKRLNYNITAYSNPVEALETFRADPDAYDIVITDMSMPELSGPEMVRGIQELRPELPVIMVTGYIRPADLEQARHLGIRELVLKPNTVDEMSEVLQRVLDQTILGARAESETGR
jgi:PAS domain S-box-containing protein